MVPGTEFLGGVSDPKVMTAALTHALSAPITIAFHTAKSKAIDYISKSAYKKLIVGALGLLSAGASYAIGIPILEGGEEGEEMKKKLITVLSGIKEGTSVEAVVDLLEHVAIQGVKKLASVINMKDQVTEDSKKETLAGDTSKETTADDTSKAPSTTPDESKNKYHDLLMMIANAAEKATKKQTIAEAQKIFTSGKDAPTIDVKYNPKKVAKYKSPQFNPKASGLVYGGQSEINPTFGKAGF
jgi:hypothetical protein